MIYICVLIHKFTFVCPAVDIPFEEAEYLVHCTKFQQKRLALVVPFLSVDSEKLAKWLGTFDTMKPCSEMCGGPTADLIFYNNRDHLHVNLTKMVANITATFEATTNGRACFKDMKFMSARLNDYEDYRKGLIHRGPRNMFWRAFDMLGGEYDYFFQNEPDIDPIRPYWLDALINETMLPKFWIRGTVHKKHGVRLAKSPPEYWAHRTHLNGAALYNLADEEFTKGFIGRVRSIPDDGPFDFAIENYTTNPANWEYMMDHLDKFQYADFVQNVINDNITRAEILERFPATYLVHGIGRIPGICGSCEAEAKKKQQEKEWQEKERLEKERQEKERQEKERQEKEKQLKELGTKKAKDTTAPDSVSNPPVPNGGSKPSLSSKASAKYGSSPKQQSSGRSAAGPAKAGVAAPQQKQQQHPQPPQRLREPQSGGSAKPSAHSGRQSTQNKPRT